MTPAAELSLADTLGLVRDYSGHSDGIWNIYVAGISVLLAAATSDKLKLPRWLLLAVFAFFAAGNLWALTHYYDILSHLIAYARTLPAAAASAPQLALLLDSLVGLSKRELIAYHLLLDVLVVGGIVYLTKRRTQPSQRSK